MAIGDRLAPAHPVVIHLDTATNCGSGTPARSASVVFDPTNVAMEFDLGVSVSPDRDGYGSQLRQLVRSRSRALKQLLLDQHLIAGIGNIYADEILHASRLRPDRISNTLTPRSEAMLHDAIHDVLTAAIASGGSTLRDTQYVDLFVLAAVPVDTVCTAAPASGA